MFYIFVLLFDVSDNKDKMFSIEISMQYVFIYKTRSTASEQKKSLEF